MEHKLTHLIIPDRIAPHSLSGVPVVKIGTVSSVMGMIGRIGGRSKSKAKVAAARANWAKAVQSGNLGSKPRTAKGITRRIRKADEKHHYQHQPQIVPTTNHL